jgi:hypothetical protein
MSILTAMPSATVVHLHVAPLLAGLYRGRPDAFSSPPHGTRTHCHQLAPRYRAILAACEPDLGEEMETAGMEGGGDRSAEDAGTCFEPWSPENAAFIINKG